jgi:AraC-like DNA-binding protein
MLKNTDMSVSEIAIACGYATTAHFCAAFHDYHQQTALQYRQMARGGPLSEALLDGGGPRHEWTAIQLSYRRSSGSR